MRGIAGEEDAALAVGRREPPMNAIRPHFQHVDVGIRHDVLQEVPEPFVGQRLLGALTLAGIKAGAPYPRQAQKAEGPARLPAIGHIGQAFEPFVKRKPRGREYRGLGIDVAG